MCFHAFSQLQYVKSVLGITISTGYPTPSSPSAWIHLFFSAYPKIRRRKRWSHAHHRHLQHPHRPKQNNISPPFPTLAIAPSKAPSSESHNKSAPGPYHTTLTARSLATSRP